MASAIGSNAGLAKDLLDVLDVLAGGVHAGFRPAHAKGLMCEGTFVPAPEAGPLESVYEELGTRLAKDRKRVEVTSAFAAGGAVLLLLGGALSSHWFRRAL
jgi:hypothetical protein